MDQIWIYDLFRILICSLTLLILTKTKIQLLLINFVPKYKAVSIKIYLGFQKNIQP